MPSIPSTKSDKSVAQQLCDAFEICRRDREIKAIDTFIIEDDIKSDIQKPLWIYTVFWLIHRNFLIVMRDPTIQKLQIVQKIVSDGFALIYQLSKTIFHCRL